MPGIFHSLGQCVDRGAWLFPVRVPFLPDSQWNSRIGYRPKDLCCNLSGLQRLGCFDFFYWLKVFALMVADFQTKEKSDTWHGVQS